MAKKSKNGWINEFRQHEREFIEFRAVQEERFKTLDRRLTELRDSIKERDIVTDTHESTQSQFSLDLNDRVLVIETELQSSRRFAALMITIGCAISATVATVLPMIFS